MLFENSKVPHPVFDMEGGEVCLIVKENHEEYREMLRAGKLPPQVKKVLDLKKLRTVYHQFEARRKLANSYDLFLVDKFARELAMPLLGVEFFRRKKFVTPFRFSLAHPTAVRCLL